MKINTHHCQMSNAKAQITIETQMSNPKNAKTRGPMCFARPPLELAFGIGALVLNWYLSFGIGHSIVIWALTFDVVRVSCFLAVTE